MEPNQRRQQILEHAATLFGQSGYHATSISDIIKSAGIARGTFYLYFESKRAIFAELLDNLVRDINKRIRMVDVTEGAPSAREQLLDNFTDVIELLTENRSLTSILFEGAVGLDQGFAEKLASFYEETIDNIESSIIMGREINLVRPCDTRMVALIAVGALKELLHDMLRTQPKRSEIREIASQYLDIFLQGILVEGESIP